jgi:hypothetical protein
MIALFKAFTLIPNMAAAAILKAIGHFRFCIFYFDRMSQTYFSNELLQFQFVFKMAAAAISDLMIGDIRPKI